LPDNLSDTHELDSLLQDRDKLPAFNERRRVALEDCSMAGNPYLDVDEGIADEVRIFNDVLGLLTYSSCEGHLSKKIVQASIHSRLVNSDQLDLIKKVICQEEMLPLK
jgi:tRNA(Phe) wybutosine-synthesizing methylase Tyw3